MLSSTWHHTCIGSGCQETKQPPPLHIKCAMHTLKHTHTHTHRPIHASFANVSFSTPLPSLHIHPLVPHTPAPATYNGLPQAHCKVQCVHSHTCAHASHLWKQPLSSPITETLASAVLILCWPPSRPWCGEVCRSSQPHAWSLAIPLLVVCQWLPQTHAFCSTRLLFQAFSHVQEPTPA